MIPELPQMSGKWLGKSFLQSILKEWPYLSLDGAYFRVSTYHRVELNNCLYFIFTYSWQYSRVIEYWILHFSTGHSNNCGSEPREDQRLYWMAVCRLPPFEAEHEVQEQVICKLLLTVFNPVHHKISLPILHTVFFTHFLR